ncbi:MAG: DUF3343 domain-containing protein [Oscillospiraceae bacterium]|nr:DUF3343 domain-containing protein [Oscillospiraceae bacterium]
MRQKKPTLVITFKTTTQAMAVEKYCLEHNLPGRIIPVPREITAGCGLSWKAAPADQEVLTAALTESGLGWQEMHVIEI